MRIALLASLDELRDLEGEISDVLASESNHENAPDIQNQVVNDLRSQDQYQIDHHHNYLLESFTQTFLTTHRDTIPVKNILCGAHSLQLSVEHAIKICDNDTKLITKCRFVMTKLRTQNLSYLLSRENFKKAVDDCVTRWNSTFLLVSINKSDRATCYALDIINF